MGESPNPQRGLKLKQRLLRTRRQDLRPERRRNLDSVQSTCLKGYVVIKKWKTVSDGISMRLFFVFFINKIEYVSPLVVSSTISFLLSVEEPANKTSNKVDQSKNDRAIEQNILPAKAVCKRIGSTGDNNTDNCP